MRARSDMPFGRPAGLPLWPGFHGGLSPLLSTVHITITKAPERREAGGFALVRLTCTCRSGALISVSKSRCMRQSPPAAAARRGMDGSQLPPLRTDAVEGKEDAAEKEEASIFGHLRADGLHVQLYADTRCLHRYIY